MTDFIRIPGNPVPEGGEIAMLDTPDGARLRVAWFPRENARGCVMLLNGRSEFIEKYFEVVEDLRAREFCVATMDWRGQGLSTRMLPDSRDGHITDFATFTDDLRHVIAQWVSPRWSGPSMVLAHSMGGMAALKLLADGYEGFSCAVLSAPMTRLFPSSAMRAAARAYAQLACALGASRRAVLGVKEEAFVFDGNQVTHDPARFERFTRLQQAAPDAMLGAPTYGWSKAALAATAAIARPGVLEAVTTPTLVLSAAEDTIVDPTVHAEIASRLSRGRYVRIEGARHEILMETDEIRACVWAAFDAFADPILPRVETAAAV